MMMEQPDLIKRPILRPRTNRDVGFDKLGVHEKDPSAGRSGMGPASGGDGVSRRRRPPAPEQAGHGAPASDGDGVSGAKPPVDRERMSEVRIGTSGWSYPGETGGIAGTASSIPRLRAGGRLRPPVPFDELALLRFGALRARSRSARRSTGDAGAGDGQRLGRADAGSHFPSSR